MSTSIRDLLRTPSPVVYSKSPSKKYCGPRYRLIKTGCGDRVERIFWDGHDLKEVGRKYPTLPVTRLPWWKYFGAEEEKNRVDIRFQKFVHEDWVECKDPRFPDD